MPLRVADGVMGLLFLLSAAVQYNDPDPFRWVAVYLAGAAVCLVSAWKPRTPAVAPAAVVFVVSAVWAATILPRVVGTPGFPTFRFGHGMENEAIEETRELGGLVITAAWMVVVALRGALKGRQRPTRGAAPR